MINFSVAFSIIIIASIAHPLKAQTPSPEILPTQPPTWQLLVFHPLRFLQGMYEGFLDAILELRYMNDENEAEGIDRELFANLTAYTDAIRREIQQKDEAMMNVTGPNLETKEAAECKNIYLNWRKMGDELWHSFYLVRYNGMAKFEMCEEKLRKTAHFFAGFEKYLDMLEECINMDEYLLSHGPLVCTIRVIVESLLYLLSNYWDFNTYLDATIDLMRLREKISDHDQSRLAEFYKRGETITSETQNCLDKLKRR